MQEISQIAADMQEMAVNAKRASRSLGTLSSAAKDKVLLEIAELISTRRAELQQENRKDLEAGRAKGLTPPMLDRLELSDSVIDEICDGLTGVAALTDPVGAVEEMVRRPNGLLVGRMRVPLGVICMIYESRPNVTIDAAMLCLKTGNSVILRGGSEAINSNLALASILKEVLSLNRIDQNAVQVVSTTDRQAITTLLEQEELIDLVIPRGGEGLIRFVAEHSRIPVLKHYQGVCHIYLDQDADLAKATPIILNSKVQRPGVCNALEGLLVHQAVAREYLPIITRELRQAGVEIVGCDRALEHGYQVKPASAEDWGREFLQLKLCLKVVSSMQEAQDYIARYGSRHTEVILTENYSAAQQFLAAVDASAVMVNAATRFNDGGQLGLGTEIGISTTKLHAYGPMGLKELTARKFVIYGTGQTRA